MAARSLVEEELHKRLSELEANFLKLQESHGAAKTSVRGAAEVTTRLKSVEGTVTSLAARMDKIEASVKSTDAKK
jgi:hypothetical protein